MSLINWRRRFPPHRVVEFFDKLLTFIMSVGSCIFAGGVVVVVTHGAGLPFLAGVTPMGATATKVTAIIFGCASGTLGGLALLRKCQEDHRLNRKFAAMVPKSVTVDVDPTKSISAITEKYGLIRADDAQFGAMTYWQHDGAGSSPSLVCVKEYEINGPNGVKITLQPVSGAAKPRPTNESPTPARVGSMNESFSSAPLLSPYGTLPPTFCIWVLRNPTAPKSQAAFPKDYVMFLAGDRMKADTPSGAIGIACYHSMAALKKNYDPEDCYITVGFKGDPIPYTSVATTRRFPDKFTWLIEPDPAVLRKLESDRAMPPLHEHLNDLVAFEWPFQWSRLTGVKAMSWKVESVPNAVSTMMSVNNDAQVYSYDTNVRILEDAVTVSVSGATLSTAETGPGGSSCKAWRKSGDEWYLNGLHHGGMPGVEGYRNRLTPGQVILQLVKKYEGKNWKPIYSQAFESIFNPLAQHVSAMIEAEDRFQVPIDAVPKDMPEVFSYTDTPERTDPREALNETYYAKPQNEGIMARSQWQNMIRKLHRRTGNHKLAKALLYHAHSSNVAQFDPEAAEMARLIIQADSEEYERIYGEGSWQDLREEYAGYAAAIEREKNQWRELDSFHSDFMQSISDSTVDLDKAVYAAIKATPGVTTDVVAEACKISKYDTVRSLFRLLRQQLVGLGYGMRWTLAPGAETRWTKLVTAQDAEEAELAQADDDDEDMPALEPDSRDPLPLPTIAEEEASEDEPEPNSLAPAPAVPVATESPPAPPCAAAPGLPPPDSEQRVTDRPLMTNEAYVDWNVYKGRIASEPAKPVQRAVAKAKAKAKAKSKWLSTPKNLAAKAVNHAPCLNESYAHDSQKEPVTLERDYAILNAEVGLDDMFHGYPRYYPVAPYPAGGGPVLRRDEHGDVICRFLARDDTKPFPREHLPEPQDYAERTDGCVQMPRASRASQDHFEYYLKAFLDWGGGDYMGMKIEVFGQILSAISGTLDGSLQDTLAFQTFLGKQIMYEPRDTNVQNQSPVDPTVARFIGLAPYGCNQKAKPWFHHPTKDGWFKEWADLCWDDTTNRPTGAVAASGPEYIRKSLNSQFGRKKHRSRKFSLEHLQEFSQGLPAPVWNSEITLGAYLREVFRGVQLEKGPAWGKITGERTKGEWLADGNNVLSVIYRIMLLTATNHSLLVQCSPLDLFSAGLLVPEELFGKNEIHLNKKVDSDRLRVIWNAGIAGELVMRFLHNPQNKLEIQLYQLDETHCDAFPYFGSCVGMGHHDEGNEAMKRAMKRMLSGDDEREPPPLWERKHNGVSTDPTGWDISVTRALWMTDAYRRADAARSGHFPFGWCYALMNLGLVASAHVIVVGKEMFELRWFGVMPSGIPSTSSSNSFMRCEIHSEAVWASTHHIGVSLSMGDDSHAKDETLPEYKDTWRDLGVIIDDPGETLALDEPISFTSHSYDLNADGPGSVTFENGPKILLRLAYAGHQDLTRDQATGIRFAVRHTPGLRERVDAFVAEKNKSWLDIDIHDPAVAIDLDTVF